MSSRQLHPAHSLAGSAGEKVHPECAEDGSGLKLQLLASLNHEIRTPLSGVLGAVDLLLETPLNGEQREYARMARESASGLLELLNDTLEYTSLASGCAQLDEAEFDLSEALQAAVAGQMSRAQDRSIQVDWILDPKMPRTVVGDALRLRQVLQFLLRYAIGARVSGCIGVSTRVEATTGHQVVLRLSVEVDAGLRASAMADLLNEFEQSGQGVAARFQSEALELALAGRVAGLLGGELTFGDAPEAVRLTALVRLRAPAAGQWLSGRAGSPGEAARHILVVEDNLVSQRVLRAVLAKGDFHVECAGDGQSALSAASNRRFGLVLMDLFMPGMDGLETLSRLRMIPGYERTPVLALTAEVSDQIRVLCRQSGMAAFLNKPIHAAELLAAVRRYLPYP